MLTKFAHRSAALDVTVAGFRLVGLNAQRNQVALLRYFFGGKLDTEAFDTYLNELGREGWELVNAFDTNQSYGASRDVVAVFKRPR